MANGSNGGGSNVAAMIGLVAILLTAAGGMFAVDQRLQSRMYAIDAAWQERLRIESSELRSEIRALPPDWLRVQVDRNTARIERLEQREAN